MLVLSILSIDDTQRNISLNESSRTFLFRRSGELDSQLFPKRVSLKTHTTTVKEVNENILVPWFSTLYILIVITRTLFTVTECAINSFVILATITYLKEKRGSHGSYFIQAHIGPVCPSSPSVCWPRISRSIFEALSALVTTLHVFGRRQQQCCVPWPYHGSSTSTFSIAS